MSCKLNVSYIVPVSIIVIYTGFPRKKFTVTPGTIIFTRMDNCDWLLSVEKACDCLRIERGVTGNFLLEYPPSIIAAFVLS